VYEHALSFEAAHQRPRTSIGIDYRALLSSQVREQCSSGGEVIKYFLWFRHATHSKKKYTERKPSGIMLAE
jgi:hypothetical protein